VGRGTSHVFWPSWALGVAFMRPSLQCILFGSAAALAIAIVSARVPDIVLCNGTASMPVGFYLRSNDPVALGSIVTVNVHEVARAYALERGAGSAFRLLKRIAATDGNIVCADGDQITIDGEVRALRSARDSIGRALPSWSGCVQLREGQYLVLGDSADSFEGRYFGIVSASDIEGVWRPIFQSR
jgi:conjugative transfer signal peptidase TraF